MIVTKDAMQQVGERLAAVLRAGDVLALSGDLGAGKTTLARCILTALGLEGEAPSPSFAIVQPYSDGETRLPVLHVDLYRIEHAADIDELGLWEARRDHVLIIEWPERLGPHAPKDMLTITLSDADGDARRLTANVPAAWRERWPLPQ